MACFKQSWVTFNSGGMKVLLWLDGNYTCKICNNASKTMERVTDLTSYAVQGTCCPGQYGQWRASNIR